MNGLGILATFPKGFHRVLNYVDVRRLSQEEVTKITRNEKQALKPPVMFAMLCFRPQTYLSSCH